MKALVVNAVGAPFDFEDVDIAGPIGREVLVDVRASGLCHTDLLFGTHDFAPTPSMLGHSRRGWDRGRSRSYADPRRRSSSRTAFPVQIVGSKLQFELLAKNNAKGREVSPLQVNCPGDEAGRLWHAKTKPT